MFRYRLVTEHLVLRKAREDDLDAIYNNIWSDEPLNEMMFWEATKTKEEAKDKLMRTIEYQKYNHGFFVALKDTDEVIGFAGMRQLELPGFWEDSGICLAKKEQGKGYGKEILKALIDYTFLELHGTRFIYSCFIENERSRNLCTSFGFKKYATKKIMRDRDKKEVELDFFSLDIKDYAAERKEKIKIEKLFDEEVDFDTFSKSDFRVVKVLSCEAVPKSKKLLKFELDDGSGETRIILSGIHAFYEPEELVGRKVIAILNLPPRNMMGIDSCGMLMSSVYEEDGEEKLNLMIVDSSIPAGAKLY